MAIPRGRLLRSDAADGSDIRCGQHPFSNNNVQFIVHRHTIRQMLAYNIALKEAKAAGQPLLVVPAGDTLRPGQVITTHEPDVRRQLLNITNFQSTKYLPSLVFLFPGMRVLVFDKISVDEQIMNGTEATVEHVQLRNDDPAMISWRTAKPGEIVQTAMVPTCACVRVTGGACYMTHHTTQNLPRNADPQGLLFLKPKEAYLQHNVTTMQEKKAGVVTEGQIKVHYLRLQFPLLPASVRTVYAAQGEAWNAVVADLYKPPRMAPQMFWLACYVMLSRARTLKGLLLMRLPEKDELNVGPPAEVLQEMEGLKQVEAKSYKELLQVLEKDAFRIPTGLHETIAEMKGAIETITRLDNAASQKLASDISVASRKDLATHGKQEHVRKVQRIPVTASAARKQTDWKNQLAAKQLLGNAARFHQQRPLLSVLPRLE